VRQLAQASGRVSDTLAWAKLARLGETTKLPPLFTHAKIEIHQEKCIVYFHTIVNTIQSPKAQNRTKSQQNRLKT